MLGIFTQFADKLTYGILRLDPSPLASGLHFFIEDTSKILVLLVLLIYVISFIRASLSVERVRDYLQGKNRYAGYFLGALFGAITPFCSCSSIPLFMGFISARIPVGITIAFLVTSPLINEVVVIMLGGILGMKFTAFYIAAGMLLGILAGIITDHIHAYRWLQPFLLKAYTQKKPPMNSAEASHSPSSITERHIFAKNELKTILSRVWKWVLIGVGIGAFIHGYIPAQWFQNNLSTQQWWSVPLASLVAIPMYTNATGVVPVMASLLDKGIPIGTALAFCMSAVAVSLPEFMMLKQVMQMRFLAFIAGYILIAISLVGWLSNYLY
ncbi:putative two-component membrane permease complex subunit [invertebrate metagenome]|uniref:Putative two-component membrane permease complex subunit n=1 Tax=invertebrate metagenome TaxID=1711999 RepID=A0A2H9TCZ8_9ZZZZ